MSEQGYSKKITVSVNAKTVWKAITREVDKWWTTESIEASNIGDVLTIRFGESGFMSMEVEEVIPNNLLVWKVVSANMYIEGGGTKNDEWVGTNIQWKIKETKIASEVTLFHEGLVPSFECYDACQRGWDYFLESLKDFLDSGKGNPYKEPLAD